MKLVKRLDVLGLTLNQPVGERAQLSGAGPDLQPFTVVVVFDLDVGHHDGQHLLVHVNPRDLVRYRYLLVGAESVPPRITQGRELSLFHRRSTTLNYSVNHARSGSNNCSASIAPWLISISPLPAQHRHSAQSPRFSCPFAGLQAQPQPVAEIVPASQPTNPFHDNNLAAFCDRSRSTGFGPRYRPRHRLPATD